jgi:OFA family oxalate/formate antiporter-like MFS transporter
VREQPADLGQVPDGGAPDNRVDAGVAEALPAPRACAGVYKTTEDWTLREAVRTPALWLYVVSLLGFSAGYPLYLAHGVAHLKDLGFTPAEAASSISIMLLCALFGTLMFAAVADSIEPRFVWSGASVVFAIGMLLAMRASGSAGLYIYAICMGTSFGAMFSAMMVVPANYYGVKAYPSVISSVMVVGTVAGSMGAWISGIVFDRTGSYTPVFYSVAGMSFLAAILLLMMKPARKPAGGLVVTTAEHA